MESERVVVQAPMSFVGSARRIWMIQRRDDALQVPLTVLALVLIPLAWCFVVAWYVFFGILVIPWRLLRRGQRRRRQEELRHREVLAMAPPYRAVPPPIQRAVPPPPPVLAPPDSATQRADDPPGFF